MTTQVEKKFGFRKTKDDNGAEVAAPEPILVKLNLCTLEDVIRLANSEDAKVQEMLVDAVNTPILSYCRDLIDEIGIEDVRTGGIPSDRYSFEIIANLPPTARGAGIEDEVWKAFAMDYQEVITATGIDAKRAEVGAAILVGKLNKVKNNKDALEQFKQRINIWFSNSSKQEDLASVYQYLNGRVEKFLVANAPQNVLASF